jgi:hypothetical protein
MKTKMLLLLVTLLVLSCEKTKTNYGKDFVGVWESNDHLNLKIEIKEQQREGKVIEHRFEVKILEQTNDLPYPTIKEGQYNYQVVTAKPQDNQHPFTEFIHLNTFNDPIPYMGLSNDKKVLHVKYRNENLKELTFTKVNP